jgi:hypothetical protein
MWRSEEIVAVLEVDADCCLPSCVWNRAGAKNITPLGWREALSLATYISKKPLVFTFQQLRDT